MRRMRHLSIRQQAHCLNQMLRGHYAYYGIAGNIRALQRVHRAVERYWRKMLSSRSWKGQICWEQFQRIKARYSAAATKAVSPLRGVASYRRAVNQLLTSVVREICTPRSVGAGERATAPGHPVGNQQWLSLTAIAKNRHSFRLAAHPGTTKVPISCCLWDTNDRGQLCGRPDKAEAAPVGFRAFPFSTAKTLCSEGVRVGGVSFLARPRK